MYDELVKALRNNADHYTFTGDNGLVHLLTNAADAIEELAAFKAQITDGRFYVYKLGTLFELRHDPRDLTVKFQYPEPPKEG